MARPQFLPVEQGSPEWLKLRRTGIGASDIPVITGDAPWGDVRTLYQDKLGIAAETIATRVMATGKRLEPIVLAWYAEDYGQKVQRVHGIYRHPEIPFVITSLDGLTARRPRRVVEVKVAESLSDEWGEEGTDQVPDHYREQLEWEMLAAGAEVADLVVFLVRYRRLARFTAARDQSLADVLLGYGTEFWRHVTERTPPEPPARRDAALVRLRADEIEPTRELVDLALLHAALDGEKRQTESALNEVKAEIRAALDDVGGTRGLLPDGRRFSIAHRPTADWQQVEWELVAREYRAAAIAAGVKPEDLDAVVDGYVTRHPGTRPLRVSIAKERRDRAA